MKLKFTCDCENAFFVMTQTVRETVVVDESGMPTEVIDSDVLSTNDDYACGHCGEYAEVQDE